MIADFEAYLLRLISSPLLMRLAACGGYCALPHTCVHSQQRFLLLSPPLPGPPQRNTAWLEEKSGISSRETFFSLQQANSCLFFLLSLSPGVGKAFCHSLLAGFLQALSSGALIGDSGDVRLSCIFLLVSPMSEGAGGFLCPIQCIIVSTHLLVTWYIPRASEALGVHLQPWDSAGKEVLVRAGEIALVLYLEMKTLHLNFLSYHQ